MREKVKHIVASLGGWKKTLALVNPHSSTWAIAVTLAVLVVFYPQDQWEWNSKDHKTPVVSTRETSREPEPTSTSTPAPDPTTADTPTPTPEDTTQETFVEPTPQEEPQPEDQGDANQGYQGDQGEQTSVPQSPAKPQTQVPQEAPQSQQPQPQGVHPPSGGEQGDGLQGGSGMELQGPSGKQ